MRLFIAIQVPEELKAKLIAFQKQIAETGADIKLVEPENLHYNLKFIGEVPDWGPIKAAIKSIRGAPFKITVFGMGAFPGTNYVRVVWLGTREGTGELTALSKAIESNLELIGIPRDERGFSAHLTLARVHSERGHDALVQLIQKNENTEIGSFNADCFILYGSTLTPQGPVYKELARYQLG